MRWVTLVLATLLLVGGAALGTLRMGTNFEHAKTMQKDLDTASKVLPLLGKNHKLVKQIESYKGKPSRVKLGGVLLLIAALAALCLLAFTFIKSSSFVLYGSIGLLVLLAAVVVINPDYVTGATSAASARLASYIVAIPLAIGGLLALASDRLRLRKQSAAA